MSYLSPAALQNIGMQVCEHALIIFQRLKRETDFCIQDSSGSVVIFGGHARLCWTINRGFWPMPGEENRSFATDFVRVIGDPNVERILAGDHTKASDPERSARTTYKGA